MKKIVIALSSPPGSGASTVGKIIAGLLKLEYFSPGSYFKKMSEKGNETESAMSFLGTERGSSKELHKHIDDLQLEKAKKGNVLIEGTLSIHFLKDIADYKIWIYASLEERARRTSKRDGMNLGSALKDVKEREERERDLFKKIYGFDYLDQKAEADLSIDTTRMETRQVVNSMMNFIKRRNL